MYNALSHSSLNIFKPFYLSTGRTLNFLNISKDNTDIINKSMTL